MPVVADWSKYGFGNPHITRHVQNCPKGACRYRACISRPTVYCAAARPLTRPTNYSAGGDPCGSRGRFAADALGNNAYAEFSFGVRENH